MTQPHSRPGPAPQIVQPAGFEGRAGFALAAFAMVVAMVMLLDRVGAPARLVSLMPLCLGLAGLATAGIVSRTMQVSQFYTGGRCVAAASLAMALSAPLLAMALPALPPVAGQPGLATLMAGLAGGLFLAGFATGPMLRTSGAFSLAGLLAGRFPGTGLPLACMAVAAALSFLLALAGLALATAMLVMATGLSRPGAAVVLCVALILIAVPGGLRGVTRVAGGAFGLAAGGVGVALALRHIAREPLPLPGIGDSAAMVAALARMADWPGVAAPLVISPVLASALAIGLGCLPALVAGFAALPRAGASRRAGLLALAATGLVLAGAIALIAAAVNGLDRDMIDHKPDMLPAYAYAASGRGLMPVCGQNVANPAEAAAACARLPGFGGVIRAQDLAPGSTALLLGMTQPPQALTSVIVAALAALGLALAAGSLQALATIIAHDGLHRARQSRAMTSRRLAIARIVLIAACTSAAAIAATQALDPRLLSGVAVLASAALLAPVLLLVVWPLATSRDALLALVAGGLALIAQTGEFLRADADSAARAALAAAGCAVAAGVVASLFHRRRGAGAGFLRALMRRGADVLPPDAAA